MLPRVEDVPQEARRQLLIILSERGRIRPGDLGVSRAYFYQLRHGLRQIPDHILSRLLEVATDDDLAQIPYFAQYVNYERVRGLDVDRIVKLFLEWARANPASAKVALDTIQAEVERLGLTGRVIRVTEEHLGEWKMFLEARIREGRISGKTARDRDRYLRRALEDLDYLLGPARLQSYIRRLTLEAPDLAAHTAKALRLFIKHILRSRELYEAVPSVQPRRPKREAPSWEEICRVIEAVEWPPARVYMLLLAATGVRSGYIRDLRIGQLDLGRRMIMLEVEETTKRQYIAFFTEPVREYLENVYLPWRQVYVESKGLKSDKLLPIRRDRLHNAVYTAMDEVLGRRFQPYSIRHRVLTHFARHLPSLEAKLLSGHVSREVYLEYYYQLDRLEELRSKYDEAMARVPCL